MRKVIWIKVIIHRGTNQIGGCLTEIQSDNGTKILIDIGANLPDSNGKIRPEIELEGLTIGKPSYDAIFITHYHGDHIGLYNKIKPEIPIYIGKISKGIYMILQNRLSKARIVSKEDLERISLFNEFTIKEKILIKEENMKKRILTNLNTKTNFNNHNIIIGWWVKIFIITYNWKNTEQNNNKIA